MVPFTKILVPVDFSAHASEAIRYAVDLSLRYEAQLSLLFVSQPFSLLLPELYYPFTASQLTEVMSKYAASLERMRQQAITAGAKTVTTHMVDGSPAGEIVGYAKTQTVDLIVMGTHGHTGIKHALLGSVAEQVVRTALCPVLTVRLTENS